MMTNKEIIHVVTAHSEGMKIEESCYGSRWWPFNSQWDFMRKNYRVAKPEPKLVEHYPVVMTEAQAAAWGHYTLNLNATPIMLPEE